MDRKCGAIPLLCPADLHVRASRWDSNRFNVPPKRDLCRPNNQVDIKPRTICVPGERHMQFGVAKFSDYDYGQDGTKSFHRRIIKPGSRFEGRWCSNQRGSGSSVRFCWVVVTEAEKNWIGKSVERCQTYREWVK
jgi:hypothetical protein